MQRINFTETTLTTLKRNARCSFANAVYKLTMKAQQGLKCDDLFKKSVLMNEVNKLLCKYKLDTCVSFHPYLEGGISTWTFGIGTFTGMISYYLKIDDDPENDILIGRGNTFDEIFIDINNNTESTGVSAVYNEDETLMTVSSPIGCFIKADLYATKDPVGIIPATPVTFLAGKCPQVETCVDYTEEELNCITPQDLQLLFEFTHKYKETLAKSTKKITSPSTSSSSPSPSDCCNWGSIGGSIGNQSDLITYLANIQKNYISIDNEGTEITNDVKSINFTGSGVNATYSGSGNVTVDIPGGGGGGGFECADLEGCNISLLTNDAGYLTEALTYTVNNGLTEDPANNFKLGGTLIEDTVITQPEFQLTFTGSRASKDDNLISINTTSGLGKALKITSIKNALEIDSSGTGVTINSVTPIFAGGTAASNLRVTNGNVLQTTSALTIGKVNAAPFVSQVNSGVSINFAPGQDTIGAFPADSVFSCLYENATNGSIETKFRFVPIGVGASFYSSTLETYGSGKLKLPAYGKSPANFTGTAVYNLAVDSSGNVIERTGATGSFISQDGKTITVTNGLITSIVI